MTQQLRLKLKQQQQMNKTPKSQKQVPQASKMKLKELDSKLAHAARKAKIALAVARNAQMRSVNLNVGEVPLAHQVKIQPQLKLPKHTTSAQMPRKGKQHELTPGEIKALQKQHLRKQRQVKPISQVGVKPLVGVKKEQIVRVAGQKRQ